MSHPQENPLASGSASRGGLTRVLWMAGLGCVAALVACGGSSSSAPSAPVAATQTLGGIAATGAPVAAGNVLVQCAGGSSLTGTTSASGAWSVNISGQTFPCVITVSGGSSALTIHSVAKGTGTVNVTPLTDLILAAAVGTDPSAWLASRGNSLADALAALVDRLAAAQAAVKANMAAAGYTLPDGDVFTAQFTPRAGDPYDDLLEKISKSLASAGLGYADLVATISAAGTSTTADASALFNTTALTAKDLASMPQINSASLSISGDALSMKTYATAGSPVGAFVGGGRGNKAVLQLTGFNGVKLRDFQSMALEMKSISTPPTAQDNSPPYVAVNLMIDLNCNLTPLSSTATVAEAQARHRLLTFDPYYEFMVNQTNAVSTTQFKTITFGPDTGGWRISAPLDNTGLPINPAVTLQDTLSSTLNSKFNYTDYPNACIVDGISADGGMFRDTGNAACNTGGGLAGTDLASCGKPHSGVFLFLGRSSASLDAEWQLKKVSVNKRSFVFR